MSISPSPMSNIEWIIFCYQKLLKRLPKIEEQTHFLSALDTQQLSREEFVIAILTCGEFENAPSSELMAEFVPAGHFYSVVPSIETRKAFLNAQPSFDVRGIDLNIEKQIELLHQLKPFHDERFFPDEKTPPFRYYFLNPAYSYTDALVLHGMMRLFQPRRIIEVGSGFSSCMMLDTNEHFFKDSIHFTFIEPYPELLYSLIKADDKQHRIIAQAVQCVDTSIFSELEANDILFIDSTHVSKLSSDVNRLFFEILPLLKPGVLVHIHDIFWPFEYPKEWIEQGRAWNEAYLLRAFLMFNGEFELLFFSSYLHANHAKWLQDNLPLFLNNAGGHIWLRRR